MGNLVTLGLHSYTPWRIKDVLEGKPRLALSGELSRVELKTSVTQVGHWNRMPILIPELRGGEFLPPNNLIP